MRAIVIGVVTLLLLGMVIALLGGAGPIEFAAALVLSLGVAVTSLLLGRRRAKI